LLFVLIPTTMLAWLVDQTFIPILGGFNKLFLEYELLNGIDFYRWREDSLSSIDPELHKRMLKEFWPLAIVGALFWFVGCWIVIKKTYLFELKQLSGEIKRRGIAYIQYDRLQEF
jgi:hypothetical protein